LIPALTGLKRPGETAAAALARIAKEQNLSPEQQQRLQRSMPLLLRIPPQATAISFPDLPLLQTRLEQDHLVVAVDVSLASFHLRSFPGPLGPGTGGFVQQADGPEFEAALRAWTRSLITQLVYKAKALEQLRRGRRPFQSISIVLLFDPVWDKPR
jgi:hypothetical protein